MELSELHFVQPLWLWMLIAIPLVWALFLLYYRGQQSLHQLEKFIDKHLIPYLLLGSQKKKGRLWTHLLLWSFVWGCLAVAMAGPRWNFREIDTFSRDQSLAILLDLSESMNAKDISPSRLGRAKQKIEDLLNISKGVKFGLIAFAADPHMIAPITEDKETIRHLLSSLDTDLVYVQGSKLTPALEMAATMLESEPGENKAIVVISDGGFHDASAIHTAKRLAEKGIVLYSIGVGSLEGAPIKDKNGAIIKKNGSPIISKLEKEKFLEISKIGNGRYLDADHSGQEALIFDDLEKRSNVQQETHKTQRFWEEHFYLFLLPVLPFFLWWYRKGYIFALFLFVINPTYSQASVSSYFYNAEQQAKQSFDCGEYETASQEFQDPYRKGVAHYRLEDYAAAEQMFRQSTRPEVACSASYNLGNALVKQNKLKNAIAAYEDVLKKWPDHKQAKDNLELVKKMLEEQQQQQQQDKQQQKQEKDEQNKEQDQKQSDQQNNRQNEPQQNQNDNSEKKKDTADQSEEQPQKDSTDAEENTGEPQKENKPESSQDPTKEFEQNEKEAKQEQQQASIPESDKEERSQTDLDADLWLNQIKSDPKTFLKNKFYIESKKNRTKEEVDPW